MVGVRGLRGHGVVGDQKMKEVWGWSRGGRGLGIKVGLGVVGGLGVRI